jgi:hypothetical protein
LRPIHFVVPFAWLLLGAGNRTSYEAVDRVAHLGAALSAVQEAKPDVLDKAYTFVSAMERGACASDNERLRADCLISSARRFCRSGGKSEGHRCPLFMDVIASNVLSEKELVPIAERYELMRKHKDHRGELMRRLQRRYGALAVELRLSADGRFGPLAQEIDRFCHESADQSSLSWQTCSAALVWFIGRGG